MQRCTPLTSNSFSRRSANPSYAEAGVFMAYKHRCMWWYYAL